MGPNPIFKRGYGLDKGELVFIYAELTSGTSGGRNVKLTAHV